MFFFLIAQVTAASFARELAIATPVSLTQTTPVVYVSVRGDARTKSYLAPAWDPSHPPSTLGCPKRGDKAWTETISFPPIVVRFDCPVGVTYKTWEPSGRRVHIGIKSTTTLHPGASSGNGSESVTYDLVAPQ